MDNKKVLYSSEEDISDDENNKIQCKSPAIKVIDSFEKCVVVLFSDSHGRFIENIQKCLLPDKYVFESYVKPGYITEYVLNDFDINVQHLKSTDTVIILTGTNDLSKNNPDAVLNHIKRNIIFICHVQGFQVLICAVPQRFDIPASSIIHSQIQEVNNNLKNFCETVDNVNFVDIYNSLSKSDYNNHGLHLNLKGKIKITKLFKQFISPATPELDNHTLETYLSEEYQASVHEMMKMYEKRNSGNFNNNYFKNRRNSLPSTSTRNERILSTSDSWLDSNETLHSSFEQINFTVSPLLSKQASIDKLSKKSFNRFSDGDSNKYNDANIPLQSNQINKYCSKDNNFSNSNISIKHNKNSTDVNESFKSLEQKPCSSKFEKSKYIAENDLSIKVNTNACKNKVSPNSNQFNKKSKIQMDIKQRIREILNKEKPEQQFLKNEKLKAENKNLYKIIDKEENLKDTTINNDDINRKRKDVTTDEEINKKRSKDDKIGFLKLRKLIMKSAYDKMRQNLHK